MRVEEVCSKTVVSASPALDIVRAAQLMREHHVGTLVLVETTDGTTVPTGIVTDRDLVMEVLAKQVPPEQVRLGDLVTGPLRTAGAEDDLFETLERMRAQGLRRMPVVDAGKRLVGLLSVDDILGAVSKLVGDVPRLVKRARTTEVGRRP